MSFEQAPKNNKPEEDTEAEEQVPEALIENTRKKLEKGKNRSPY